MLISYFTQSSTLKMEAKCSSGTSVDFHQISRRYIPVHRKLFIKYGLEKNSDLSMLARCHEFNMSSTTFRRNRALSCAKSPFDVYAVFASFITETSFICLQLSKNIQISTSQ
jgi:hypothetical protein